ncbi:hypothetical protein, partial [Burkholderia sp. Tr-20355]|uniref:hypothetical protein n=1 Tax=Burkholderia sp. Tr-20355 TaxID=2703895 RepID=UPI00197F1ADB
SSLIGAFNFYVSVPAELVKAARIDGAAACADASAAPLACAWASCGATNPSTTATDINMLAASAASERFVIPHSSSFGELIT